MQSIICVKHFIYEIKTGWDSPLTCLHSWASGWSWDIAGHVAGHWASPSWLWTQLSPHGSHLQRLSLWSQVSMCESEGRMNMSIQSQQWIIPRRVNMRKVLMAQTLVYDPLANILPLHLWLLSQEVSLLVMSDGGTTIAGWSKKVAVEYYFS